MLGSSQSISGPNIVLNAMMAEELNRFADILEDSEDFREDLSYLIRKTFTDHQRILFDGNGYTDDWLAEAERRGLSNLSSTPEALKAYTAPKNLDLMRKHGIYTDEELEARARIHVENYVQVVSIEGRTTSDMVRKDILPAVSAYVAERASRIALKKKAGVSAAYEQKAAEKISTLEDTLMEGELKLVEDLEKIPEEIHNAMNYCHDVILSDMDAVRKAADELEILVDRKAWPFPTYSDLLFSER